MVHLLSLVPQVVLSVFGLWSCPPLAQLLVVLGQPGLVAECGGELIPGTLQDRAELTLFSIQMSHQMSYQIICQMLCQILCQMSYCHVRYCVRCQFRYPF
jgi:hypothetical protein